MKYLIQRTLMEAALDGRASYFFVSKGDTIETHPASDLWMRGAKHARVVSIADGVLRVKPIIAGRALRQTHSLPIEHVLFPEGKQVMTKDLEAVLGCRPGQERTWVQYVVRARWEREQAASTTSPHLREGHLRAEDAYLALARREGEPAMKKTHAVSIPAGWIVATYGEHDGYFSITGDIYRRWPARSERDHVACGCLRDEIAEAFPELAHLIRWHLCEDGVPMHYLANARFWYDMAHGHVACRQPEDSPERGRKHFLAHVNPLPGEDAESWLDMPWQLVAPALERRIPALRAAYRAALEGV